VKTARCYRCFEVFPQAELTRVTTACGCEQGYCLGCITRPGLVAFLGFVASRCVKKIAA
jgi:hypothetical protein